MAHTLLDDEQAKVFDLINQLGAWGIHHFIPLPQLIVCGDQSSGKSSLLSAISGFDFPIKAGKETRFATQVVLQRTPTESSNVSILPGAGASPEVRNRLESFKPPSTSLDALRNTIKKAQAAMDLGEKFSLSDNVLRVEICGPTRPHLTLIDLPGLISSTSDAESRAQIPMIEQLVKNYMLNSQSIILAVVSASTDADNQRILTMVKKADPDGERTLAVVTKPDLRYGPKGQEEIQLLVRNETYRFALGWHIVRNIDRDTFDTRVLDRNSEEVQFFSQSPWDALPRDQVGVPALQKRLSGLLCRHISKEIPNLAQAIQHKLSECTAELQKLGEARSTSTAQRVYLTSIAENFQLVVENALSARYHNTILSNPQMQLRARVRELQDSLYFSVKVHGPSLNITCKCIDLGQGDVEYAAGELKRCGYVKSLNFPIPTSMTCEAHAEQVKNGVMRDSRGLHLPTLTDPGLFWEIFKDLALPWSAIVDTHLELIFEAVSTFVAQAFRHFSDDRTYATLREEILDPALDEMKTELEVKKKELMAPYTTFASLSWNPTLIGDLVDVQLRSLNESPRVKDPSARADRLASLKLVHEAYAYYRTAQRTMVDNIANLAVEHCLLNKLRGVLKAGHIAEMSEDVLKRLASEPEDAANKRQTNESMKSALSKALKRCREHENTLRQRAIAGEDRTNSAALPPKQSPLPQSRSVMNGSSAQNSEHVRSLSAEFANLSLNRADERQPAPPLTPNRSPSPSVPRVVTPGDEDDSPIGRRRLHRKSHSSGSSPKAKKHQAPHVVEVEEEL